MMRNIASLLAWIAILGNAGCASVEGERLRQVTDGRLTYTVDPAYTQLDERHARALVPESSAVYTIDGFPLDLLAIHAGVRDGGVLGKRRFRAKMSPSNIAAMYGAALTRENGSFKVKTIEEATFAGVPGFKYEFSLQTRRLEMAGLGYGAVIDNKLYHFAYLAPMNYFFAKHLPLAEATAKSVQVRR